MARAKAKSIGETESTDIENRVRKLELDVRTITRVINENVEKSNAWRKEIAEKVENNNALLWSKVTEMELGVVEKAAETEKELGIK